MRFYLSGILTYYEMINSLDEQFESTAEKFYLDKWNWKAVIAGNNLLLTACAIAFLWLLFVLQMH